MYRDIRPAHLQHPRRRHRRADAIVVHQHNSAVPHTNESIGFLDELPTWRQA